MAGCTSCAQKRAREALLSKGNSNPSFSVGSEELVLVFYRSPNTAMHNVNSPTGALINGKPAMYGRHRGARPEEIKLFEAGELSLAKAREIKAIPFCVFWVHPMDLEFKPDVFVPFDKTKANAMVAAEEKAQAQIDEEAKKAAKSSLDAMADAAAVSFSASNTMDHKYLNDNVLASMADAGMPASAVFLSGATVGMISDHFKSSGKLSAETKAERVIEAAKELVDTKDGE